MSETPLDKVMSRKSETELSSIIEDHQGYRLEAREAALRQLESRSEDKSKFSEIKVELNNENILETKRKERKERFFYIPLGAPTTVIFCGGGLYVLLGVSLIKYVVESLQSPAGSRSLLGHLIAIVIYFFFFALVDSILKGKNWARITYLVFSGLGVITSAYVSYWAYSIIRTFEVIPLLISSLDFLLVILLFNHSARDWFTPENRKKAKDESDLLDDL